MPDACRPMKLPATMLPSVPLPCTSTPLLVAGDHVTFRRIPLAVTVRADAIVRRAPDRSALRNRDCRSRSFPARRCRCSCRRPHSSGCRNRPGPRRPVGWRRSRCVPAVRHTVAVRARHDCSRPPTRMRTPAPELPSMAVPSASVPTKLPATTLASVPRSLIRTPSPAFPAMTLRSATSARPSPLVPIAVALRAQRNGNADAVAIAQRDASGGHRSRCSCRRSRCRRCRCPGSPRRPALPEITLRSAASASPSPLVPTVLCCAPGADEDAFRRRCRRSDCPRRRADVVAGDDVGRGPGTRDAHPGSEVAGDHIPFLRVPPRIAVGAETVVCGAVAIDTPGPRCRWRRCPRRRRRSGCPR